MSILKNILRAFAFAYKSFPYLLSGYVVLTLAQAVIPYLTSGYLGNIINLITDISTTGITPTLWYALAIYIGIRLVRPLIAVFWGYFEQLFYIGFQMKVEVMVYERRAAIDIARYENAGFLNKLEQAFKQGYWPIVNLVDRSVGILDPIIAAVVGIVITANYDWRVFVLLVVFSIPAFIANYKYSMQVWGIWGEHSQESRMHGHLSHHLENRHGIVELKMFQNTKKFIDHIGQILVNFIKRQQTVENAKMRSMVIAEIISVIGSAIAIIMIVRSAVSGVIDIGTMTFLIASIATFENAITRFFSQLAILLDKNQYAQGIFEILDIEPIVTEREDALAFKPEKAPTITLENVSFKYDGADTYVLRNVSFTIPAGTKLGLVGNNGAGKTTLIRLLCRIYDPTEGRILVDGIDLRHLKIEDWRSSLGVLFQDFSSYDFITKDAIALGRSTDDMSMQRVVDAATTSESLEFIERWEKRFDQQIGVEFGGIDPSKGQKQKLALARTLYRKPQVLILDEPTASVDAESEAHIFDSIEALPNTVSAILISHRFSTVRRADSIVVMEHGTVLEQGSHDELMKKKGRYAELFTTQLEGYTL